VEVTQILSSSKETRFILWLEEVRKEVIKYALKLFK